MTISLDPIIPSMKEYDIIIIGTGSGTNYLEPILSAAPHTRVAIIDTKGSSPIKDLSFFSHLASLVRGIGSVSGSGIDACIKAIDFSIIMDRLRADNIGSLESKRQTLLLDKRIDYYSAHACFIAPYTLKVGTETITSRQIFISTGSRPTIPDIPGLEASGYLDEDTLLSLKALPSSLAIMGGGAEAVEYAHFFSSIGSAVTLIAPDLLPNEEPEIAALSRHMMSKYMEIRSNCNILTVNSSSGTVQILLEDRNSGERSTISVNNILIASGRSPDLCGLQLQKGNVELHPNGWIKVNAHLESSQKNIWAFGDAIGHHLQHVANHESTVVYYNAVLGKPVKADYHAIPRAIYSYPEIASTGMSEAQAIQQYGEQGVLIGLCHFNETCKGKAMFLQDEFVKIIIESSTQRLLGAHIIGPHASILIHELIPLMYTPGQDVTPIMYAMDIHCSLSEVIKRALYSRMPVLEYRELMQKKGFYV